MSADSDRVLAFEVGGVAWALPIADVREVADLPPLCAVPTLPSSLGQVANHRGDALPVVSPCAVLDVREDRLRPATQLLVIGGSGDEPGRLGLPVDRVLGLARAPQGRRPREGVVRARGTLDGRMLRVLDAARLLAVAQDAFGQRRVHS
jgi:chemotaxis signal transduction protein